jgi:hypothetical protein
MIHELQNAAKSMHSAPLVILLLLPILEMIEGVICIRQIIVKFPALFDCVKDDTILIFVVIMTKDIKEFISLFGGADLPTFADLDDFGVVLIVRGVDLGAE